MTEAAGDRVGETGDLYLDFLDKGELRPDEDFLFYLESLGACSLLTDGLGDTQP